MTFKTIFFLFLLALSGHLFSQEGLDFNFTNINGNVKSIKTTGTPIDSEGEESSSSRVWFNLYDKNRNDSISWDYASSYNLSEFEDSSVYIYDAGRLSQIIIYNHRGAVQGNTSFEYDNERLIKMWKKYDLFDHNTVEMEYEYPSNENYTRKLFFPIDSANYSVQTFNQQGRIIGSSSFQDDSLMSTSKISYNEFGLKSRVYIEYLNERPNRVITYEYKMDGQGNWITKKEFEQGVLKYIFRREIDYFE